MNDQRAELLAQARHYCREHGIGTLGQPEVLEVVARTIAPLIAEVQRAQQAETDFHATLAADGFIAITQAQHAEWEQWRTGSKWQWGVRYQLDDGPVDVWSFDGPDDCRQWTDKIRREQTHAPATLVRRRVGAVEQIEEPT